MKTKLEELKEKHEALLFTSNVKFEIIREKLFSLFNMYTDNLDVDGLDELEACIVYENRIKLLELKQILSDDILKAVKCGDDDLFKELDYFKESDLNIKNRES